jgi:hypothetical protein
MVKVDVEVREETMAVGWEVAAVWTGEGDAFWVTAGRRSGVRDASSILGGFTGRVSCVRVLLGVVKLLRAMGKLQEAMISVISRKQNANGHLTIFIPFYPKNLTSYTCQNKKFTV